MDHLRVLAQLGAYPVPCVHLLVSHWPVTQGCLLLFLGRIADLFGRKNTFIFGCGFMGILGLGCGFAQGMFPAPHAVLLVLTRS